MSKEQAVKDMRVTLDQMVVELDELKEVMVICEKALERIKFLANPTGK